MFLPSNITLKFGDSGDFVAELQRRLAMVKCFTEDQVNGFYDGATVNGVMAFQGQNGLHADGVAGPETLRRLNGVIAGDTSSSSDTRQEEEEKQRAQHETQLRDLALAQQEPQPAAWGEPAAVQEEAPAAAAPAVAPQAGGLDPAMFAPAAIMAAPQPSPADLADRANRELLSQNPAQELNNMVNAAAAQERVQQAAPPLQPPPQQPLPPEAMVAPQAPLAPPAAPALPPTEPAPVQQQAEPQSLVQRAGRFANAMVQKLADYFEAKLPPSVLNEVKAAGQVMAASGVREAPIPTGPEMAGPAQAPARGPEQQQGQIR